jgi:methyl-accepting chemotaxis protein
MVRLARGADVIVPCLGRKDEIGLMAETVQTFKTQAIEKAALELEAVKQGRQLEEQRTRQENESRKNAEANAFVVERLAFSLEHLSEGDLTCLIDRVFAAEYEPIRQDFNKAIEKLREVILTISTNTQAIRTGTHEVSQAAENLSRRTDEQAASLEKTATALAQITAAVGKTANGASHAREVVFAAKTDAEQSGAIVHKAIEAMSGIEKSSQQIGQIIGVIDEIAFQTNLLALNAGVEAARAGEAGRGFAVVASEVRGLAQRSAEAAKEIKSLISASTAQVGQGVDFVGGTGRALERIVIQVVELSRIIDQIAASAQEQATGLNDVNTAVNQIDETTQQNAAMAEETTAASHSLAQEANGLAQLIAVFRLGSEERSVGSRSARAA